MRQEDQVNEAANPEATPAETPTRSVGDMLARVGQVAGIVAIPVGYVFPFAFSSYMGSAAMAQAGTLTSLPAWLRNIAAVHAGAQAVNVSNFVGYTYGGYTAGVAVVSSASGVAVVAAEELVSRVGTEGAMRILGLRRSDEEAPAAEAETIARDVAEALVDCVLTESIAEATIRRNNR